MTAAAIAIVAQAEAKGSDPRDVRDATHEGWHATSLGVSWWEREEIHAAVMQLRPGERARQEVCARAAEWLVCEALGIPYSLPKWASIAAREAYRSHAVMPFDVWCQAITSARTDREVLAYVAGLLGVQA